MLFGRGEERAALDALLDDARASRSAVLVVRGEAGIGKTALLNYARERATDMAILEASGTESEAQLAFAGVDQLIRPVLGAIDELPTAQSLALRQALGLEGGAPARFLISLAILTLLSEASERRPLLCLIDDAHWLDDASADALVFVARRLVAEPIAMLFAARDDEARTFGPAGLAELRIARLDAPDAKELAGRSVDASASVRDQLVIASKGNPLALLELSAGLSPEQRAGLNPLPHPLRGGPRTEELFRARIEGLPEPTQVLLLVAAVEEGGGELTTILRAANEMGAPSSALDHAEHAGLIRVSGTRLRFSHPLVRTAVHEYQPLSRRRAAHAALAEVLDDPSQRHRRTWHRALSATAPDDRLAVELADAARDAKERAGFAVASRTFERAATLGIGRAWKRTQLAAAGQTASLAGQAERARQLLAQARQLASGVLETAELDFWLGTVELTFGRPDDAYVLLVRAAVDVATADQRQALSVLSLASNAVTLAGKPERNAELAAIASTLDFESEEVERIQIDTLLGLGALADGNSALAGQLLRRALATAAALEDDRLADPVTAMMAARPSLFLGDDVGVEGLHRKVAAATRSTGALSVLTTSLTRIAHAELWAGRFPAARATAQEGLELARDIGQEVAAGHMLVLLGLEAAVRGAADQCRSLVTEGRRLALRGDVQFTSDFAQLALASLELGLGNAEAAYVACRRVDSWMARYWGALDRIEAAARAGHTDQARAWLAEFDVLAEAFAAPWALGISQLGHGLVAEDVDEARMKYRAAVEALRDANRPFESARAELLHGELLRRSRRRLDSRQHLLAALDSFERLGADAWATRASLELRASGQTARRRVPSTRDLLTPQERQVAQFVAEGLSNREVAAQLFLSPRTIDFHLRNIFRKLRISSRVELARLELDAY